MFYFEGCNRIHCYLSHSVLQLAPQLKGGARRERGKRLLTADDAIGRIYLFNWFYLAWLCFLTDASEESWMRSPSLIAPHLFCFARLWNIGSRAPAAHRVAAHRRSCLTPRLPQSSPPFPLVLCVAACVRGDVFGFEDRVLSVLSLPALSHLFSVHKHTQGRSRFQKRNYPRAFISPS